MDSIANLLSSKFTKKTSFARQVQASLIIEFANELVKELFGKKGSEQLKVVSLKNKVITIYCTNPIIAQEIKFKQNKLINAINDKYGDNLSNRLKIVQKGIENNEY